MEKNFICKGAGSGNGNGANVPFGSYEVLGKLTLHFTYNGKDGGRVVYKNYQRELSLDSAIATCVYQVNGVNYKKEYFTSFGSDVDVIRITADKPGQINCSVSIGRPENVAISTNRNML